MVVLLPDESQLSVDKIEIEEESITLSVSSTNSTSLCPLCGTLSDRIHSNYQRHPADIPIAGYTVGLDMNVHKFFCDNMDCKRIIFTERISSILAPYARRTNRLASQQQQAAFALGVEAGSRLLAIIGMAASPDTLLRLIRRAPEPEITTPQVLGVDDWAKRKGHSYGTILVDLEAHKPVDLLPDRSAESFAKWLREHPGVEIISRDRGSEYISGANAGAPDAIQVADRWHLLTNLRDALKRLMESKRDCLRAATDKSTQDSSEEQELSPNHDEQLEKSAGSTDVPPSDNPPKLTKAEKQRLVRREKRRERFETAKELHERGLSKAEIARRLNINWRTVSKYIRVDECPIYAGRRRGSTKLDPYIDYMTKRWEEGCHNATQIWREIQKLGFDGARRTVGDWATKRRKSASSSNPVSEKIVPWSASRASWLLVEQEEKLTEDDKAALERMKQVDEKVAQAYTLGQRFSSMIRERQPEALLPWLEDVGRSGIGALMGFAKGIKQDIAAVTNALCLPWSNGQVEGQVNRLKLIKRQMYGRANFDLLRKKVLAYPMRC
jgi:transposase